jgi:iron uptake system component EfeO
VRTLDASGSPSSGSASGTGSASGSGSGTGLSASDLGGTSDDPLVAAAVEDYRAYVLAQVEEMVALTTTFTDAVRAGDLAAAQDAYAVSREPWERIEPIAGLIEDIDVAVDARVADFEGVDDPRFTGWHRLEYLLFDAETTRGAVPFADQLDEDLARLQRELPALEIPPAAVPVGASELVEEVSLGKITGEENRYAKTDLWDIGANLEGSQAAIDTLRPALEAADPALLEEIDARFAEVEATLDPLRDGDGWLLYCLEEDPFPSPRCAEPTVSTDTVQRLQAQLAALSEQTALVAGALGLA